MAPKPRSGGNNNPHLVRSLVIRKESPDVLTLFGHDPTTQFYGYGVIAIQLALAYLVRSSWLATAALCITLGPYLCACFLVFIHEASHNLVFASVTANRLIGMLVNIPMCVPVSEIFRQHHSAHHAHLGDPFMDVDTPMPIEIRLVGKSSALKALWLIFNPFILMGRALWKLSVQWDFFVVLNWVTTLSFSFTVVYLWPKAFVYLFMSFYFSQSLHPSNARVVQRHVHDSTTELRPDGVNTYSYYGMVNRWTLNVGYHVEHHDFSRVPYRKLPQLREMVGHKWYPSEAAHQDRGLMSMFQMIMDPMVGLEWYCQAPTESEKKQT